MQKLLSEMHEVRKAMENTRMQNQQALEGMERCLVQQQAETVQQQSILATVVEAQRATQTGFTEVDRALAAVRQQAESV